MELQYAYQLLELSPPTTLSEIKSHFRKLAKKYHPDMNTDPDATKFFQELLTAYETVLISCGELNDRFEEELNEEMTDFFHRNPSSRISADEDPFEVAYRHYWGPKILHMMESLKKKEKTTKK